MAESKLMEHSGVLIMPVSSTAFMVLSSALVPVIIYEPRGWTVLFNSCFSFVTVTFSREDFNSVAVYSL